MASKPTLSKSVLKVLKELTDRRVEQNYFITIWETYLYFISSTELLQYLIYEILNAKSTRRKKKLLYFLQMWVKDYHFYFEEDKELMQYYTTNILDSNDQEMIVIRDAILNCNETLESSVNSILKASFRRLSSEFIEGTPLSGSYLKEWISRNYQLGEEESIELLRQILSQGWLAVLEESEDSDKDKFAFIFSEEREYTMTDHGGNELACFSDVLQEDVMFSAMMEDLESVEKKSHLIYTGKDIRQWIEENNADYDSEELFSDLIKRNLILDIQGASKLRKGGYIITDFGEKILLRNAKLYMTDFIPTDFQNDSAEDTNSNGELFIKILEENQNQTLKRSYSQGTLKNLQRKVVSSPRTEELNFLKVDLSELAKQITLVCYRTFEMISPNEFNFKSWKDENLNSRGIDNTISESNKLSQWVKTEIITWPYHHGRIKILSNFIMLSKLLEEMGNYLGMISIILGLNDTMITRLKEIWDELEPNVLKTYKSLKEVASQEGNFSKYREIVNRSVPPFIPYIGLIMQDLLFTEDGIPTIIDDEINMSKLSKIAKIKHQIRKFQRLPYTFQKDSSILQLYTDALIIPNDDILWNLSYKIQPRSGSNFEQEELYSYIHSVEKPTGRSRTPSSFRNKKKRRKSSESVK
eukprot:TRINITY_DN9691_c0_g1_i1.p1 TRINITY_DN9691_c0_g1~~TRINITY_DN9691_c0_g1_i1.p1  ORF type:complete len:641 (+),score=131.80 TRINITY_DN9691_c0_g1_i1:34-1956(+)